MLKVKDKYDYRRELIEALRSRKYKQCKSAWKKGDSYCFFGLFYHINGIPDDFLENRYGRIYLQKEVEEIKRLRELINISCEYACLNDDGFTFRELADLLEKEV